MIADAVPTRSRQPLYVQAAEQIRLQIARGELLPGAQLPVIEALQDRFGMSRATIRGALAILEDEHLIERHRGRGTFVQKMLPRRNTHVLPTNWADLVAGLRSIWPRMVSPISEIDGSALRTPPGGTASGRYVRYLRLHARDDEPYCVIEINIAREIFDTDAEAFQTRPAILILTERHAAVIGRVRQQVRFSIADEATARFLKIALGAPVVEIDRWIETPQDRVIFHSFSQYPGEFVQLDFDFALPAGARAR